MSSIEFVVTETRIFEPSETLKKNAAVSGMAAYKTLCDEAERDYEGFWARLARELLVWHKPFTEVLDESKAPFYRWFGDGELNVSYNCLDRDSGLVAESFDERDAAVKMLLEMAISTCNRLGKYVGICGQGPSDHEDFAVWLMEKGIQTISLNPDTLIETWGKLAQSAKKT